MTIRTLSLALLVGTALLFGCKGNSNTVSPGNCDGVQALSDKYSAALKTFSADPTNKTKCNAFVDAYKAFADAAIACTSLYTQVQRDDIQKSYTQARDSCK